MNELSERDLLYNPVEWIKSKMENRNKQIYDENFRHFQQIENIHKTYNEEFVAAYDILVEHGIINDGDPLPWTKEQPNERF